MPAKPITYRLYTPKDKAQLKRCVEEVQDYFVTQDPAGWMWRSPSFGRYYTQYLLRQLKKHKGRMIFALHGTQVIGLIMGCREPIKLADQLFTRHNESMGWIYLIYVHPDYRRKGIGKNLVRQIMDYFKQQKCTVVRLEAQGNVPKLVELYASFGFKPWLMSMSKRLRKAPASKK